MNYTSVTVSLPGPPELWAFILIAVALTYVLNHLVRAVIGMRDWWARFPITGRWFE